MGAAKKKRKMKPGFPTHARFSAALILYKKTENVDKG